MPITRIDVVRLFDIDLSRGGRIPDPQGSLQTKSPSETYSRYGESFGWLFDPQDVPGSTEQIKINPTVRYLSERVNCPYSLPGFDRLSLDRNREDQSDKGGVITISRSLKIAIISVWNRYEGGTSAIDIKLSLLSGYKPNRISWLELSSNSDWESNASNTCKMGTFSRLVMLKICRIW